LEEYWRTCDITIPSYKYQSDHRFDQLDAVGRILKTCEQIYPDVALSLNVWHLEMSHLFHVHVFAFPVVYHGTGLEHTVHSMHDIDYKGQKDFPNKEIFNDP
jgi:hypothetical protein